MISLRNGAQIWLLLLSIVCAGSMWIYMQNILVPFQISQSEITRRPRGNLSDLYPRWVGARELLLRGRDPYSAQVTGEIQEGYYGRALDPSRVGDPRDKSAFVYPVYVVLLFAPTVRLSFETVRIGFLWLLIAATAASILLWVRLLGWRVSRLLQASLVILTLGSLAGVQGLKLQQLSLLVAGLIAIAVALIASDHPYLSGVVLALATIKPQLVWLLLLWFAIWTSADWRSRYRCALAFLVTMAALLSISELLLPHWISEFLTAAKEYRQYTNSASILDRLIGSPAGAVLGIGAGVAAALLCWKCRDIPAAQRGFAEISVLVLALTVLVAPTADPYNQILLVPAVIALMRDRHKVWGTGWTTRLLAVVTGLLVAWQWVASVVLCIALVILPPVIVEKAEILPFGTVLLIPVAVLSLLLVRTRAISIPSAISAKQA